MADCHICRSAKAVSICHQCKRLVCANCAPTGICSACAAAGLPAPALPQGLPQQPPPRSPYSTCRNVVVVVALLTGLLLILVAYVISTADPSEMGLMFFIPVAVGLAAVLFLLGFIFLFLRWCDKDESERSCLGELLSWSPCCFNCLQLAAALLGGLLLLLLHLFRVL